MVTVTVGVTPVIMGTGKDSVLSSITLHIVKPCLCEKGGGQGREREGRTEREGRERFTFSKVEFLLYISRYIEPIYPEIRLKLVHRATQILHAKDSIPFPLLTGPDPSPNVE